MKDIMNAQEAAEFLGYKLSYLYKLVSEGSIPYLKPRGKLYFEKDSLIGWMKSGYSIINSDKK
jgi:prophage regulatory protein